MIKRLLCLALLFVSLVDTVSFAAGRPVIVLLSDDTPTYQAPLQAFTDKINREVMIYNLNGNIKNAPAVMQQVMDHEPALIFALGAKAAYFAKLATRQHQDTAVIFAMVLNQQRYQLLGGQKNIAGIAADTAAGTQLFNMSLFSPKIKRIGVVYSPEFSTQIINKAKDAAALLGLELITQPITRAKELRRAWLQVADKADALWILNDPVLYTLENIHWIKDRCLKVQQPCMGQSDNITRLGVLLSVNPDLASIGDQAASMAKDILDNKVSPAAIGLRDPIGTRLTLNATTARKIGLVISPAAKSVVNEVLEE